MKDDKNNKKFLILFIPGTLLATGTSTLSQYFDMSDAVMGLITGLGIGLLLLGIILKKKELKQPSNN